MRSRASTNTSGGTYSSGEVSSGDCPPDPLLTALHSGPPSDSPPDTMSGPLEDLDGLRSVGGSLIIAYHPNTEHLLGLATLEYVGQGVQVVANPRLLSLDGLSGLRTVNEQVRAVPAGGRGRRTTTLHTDAHVFLVHRCS